MDYESYADDLAPMIDALSNDEIAALALAIDLAEARICRELDDLNFMAGL